MSISAATQLSRREALELKHDGHFDRGMLDQPERTPGQPTVQSLLACIKEELDYLPWVRAQRAKATTDAGRAAWDQKIACMQTRIDELERKLDALRAAEEVAA